MISYIITGILWSTFSLANQAKKYPFASEKDDLLCFMLNFVGWPIAIVIATYKLYRR